MFILVYFRDFLLNLYVSLSSCNYKIVFFYILDNYVPLELVPHIGFMGDLVYLSFDLLVFILLTLYNLFFFILDYLDYTTYYSTNSLVFKAVIVALKFLFCIAILIFSRGGIPRFRFDYLTKLG